MSAADADVFTGTWVFSAARSHLSTPAPRRWVQRIEASAIGVAIREEILSADGREGVVSVAAKFDGQPHHVAGSLIADAIIYARLDAYTIEGTGFRDGAERLRERVTASRDGELLALTYSVLEGERELASGVAVFERAPSIAEPID